VKSDLPFAQGDLGLMMFLISLRFISSFAFPEVSSPIYLGRLSMETSERKF